MLLVSNWTVMWEGKYFHICNDTSVLHSDYTKITLKKIYCLYTDTNYILIFPQLLWKYTVPSIYILQLLAMLYMYLTFRSSHGHTKFVCLFTVQPLYV